MMLGESMSQTAITKLSAPSRSADRDRELESLEDEITARIAAQGVDPHCFPS